MFYAIFLYDIYFYRKQKNGILMYILPYSRFRYYLSPATRKAFNYCSKEIDSYTNHPNCPAAVKRGVETLKGIILRFAESGGF